MKTKQLSSKWTVELVPGEIEMGEDLIYELSKNLQDEIDWEVMSTLMLEIGWSRVDITKLQWKDKEKFELEEWLKGNIDGNYKSRHGTWLFEKKSDAVLFSLRWS